MQLAACNGFPREPIGWQRARLAPRLEKVRVRSLLETFGGAPLDGMSDADAAAKVAELQSGFRAAAEGMPFAARLVEMADAQRAAAAH